MRRVPLLPMISLCLLTSCAAKLPCPPLLVKAMRCPAPSAPALPVLDPDKPLDDPANLAALSERDRLIRRHVFGLRAAVNCYEAQTRADAGKEHDE